MAVVERTAVEEIEDRVLEHIRKQAEQENLAEEIFGNQDNVIWEIAVGHAKIRKELISILKSLDVETVELQTRAHTIYLQVRNLPK